MAKKKLIPVYFDLPDKDKKVFKIIMLIFLGVILLAVFFGR